MANRRAEDEAFRRFLRRCWQQDVVPLLRDDVKTEQRRRGARLGAKVAAAGGLLIDSVLRLRGRPVTRFLTVLGSSMGAMLPDVWDSRLLRERFSPRQREQVARRVQQRAAGLELAEALALTGLDPRASREQMRARRRVVLARWHPDRAADEVQREDYRLRFVALQAAFERIEQAYADGRLPACPVRGTGATGEGRDSG